MIDRESFLKDAYRRLGGIIGSGIDPISSVYSIFKHHFGEQYVDLVNWKKDEEEFYNFMSLPLTEVAAQLRIGTGVADIMRACNLKPSDYTRLLDKWKAINEGTTLTPDKISLSDEIFFEFFYPALESMIRQRFITTAGDPYILIHRPVVVITNEYDKSHTAKDIYLKVNLKTDGSINSTFRMIKATWTLDEKMSGYEHSHKPSLGSGNAPQWGTMCLGSGPINQTIAYLSRGYDENKWMLFAYELDKYIQVESISGGPHIKMESIRRAGSNIRRVDRSKFCEQGYNFVVPNTISIKTLIKDFTESLMKSKTITFNYINGQYSIGMSFLEYNVAVSNYFIKWFNYQLKRGNRLAEIVNKRVLLQQGILRNFKVVNEVISYTVTSSSNGRSDSLSVLSLTGRDLGFKFKGNPVTLTIEAPNDDLEEANTLTLLNLELTDKILTSALAYLNLNYGKQINSIETERSHITL